MAYFLNALFASNNSYNIHNNNEERCKKIEKEEKKKI